MLICPKRSESITIAGIRDMQAVRNIQKVDPRWVDPIVFEEARCISMHARVDIRLLYKTKLTLVYGIDLI